MPYGAFNLSSKRQIAVPVKPKQEKVSRDVISLNQILIYFYVTQFLMNVSFL